MKQPFTRLLTEPARPDRIRNSPRAVWLAVACVCVGAFMGQLDASIVTLAVPSLQHELHASLDAVEWVALVYLLVLVGTVSAVGRIADMVGRKLLYTYGFAVFTLASIGCGFAHDLAVLLVMRAVQAVGAAMLQANSVALIRTTVGPERLQRAIGLQGAAQALGLCLGPAAGGALIALGGWRWVFFVNVPAGIVGIVLAVLLLPRTQTFAPRARLDWQGLTWLGAASATLLIAASQAARAGAEAVLRAVACALLAAMSLALFVVTERRAASPLVDLALFRSGAFRGGITSGALAYIVLFGVLFVSPLHLELLGSTPLHAGIIITVLPLALGVVAPFAATAARAFGTARIAGIGVVIAAAGLLAAGTAGAHLAAFTGALAVIGAGLGLFVPLNNAAVAGEGEAAQAGMVSGILNMTRGIGTALGVALAAALFGRAGFAVTTFVLAAIALAAALLTVSARQNRPVAGGV